MSSRTNITNFVSNWSQFNILYHQINFVHIDYHNLSPFERDGDKDQNKNPDKNKNVFNFQIIEQTIGLLIVVNMNDKCNGITNSVSPSY